MGLSPMQRPNLVHLMTPIKTVGHENKFSIFLTKTVKIAHFKTFLLIIWTFIRVQPATHQDKRPHHHIPHKITSLLVQTTIFYL